MKLNFLSRSTLLSLLTLSASTLMAQAPVVEARLEPDSIFIGDRFDLVIEVEKDMVHSVGFPEFEAPKESGLELVTSHPIDTLERDGRYLKLRKRYTMAAFEEGLLDMGQARILYVDKNITDTIISPNDLILQVATFQIDSTSQGIYDIKPQLNMPFRMAEITGYIKWGLLALAIFALGIYILSRILKRQGRNLGDLFKPTPPPPPHIVARKALEQLRDQKLWQSDHHKEYYSALTDILRTYIKGRFSIDAMEMTSDEILAAARSLELDQKQLMGLTTIIQEADLVKFAKATPEAETNEQVIAIAYEFVEQTKPIEEVELDEDGEPVQKEKKSRKESKS